MTDNSVDKTEAFRAKIMTWNIESLKNNIFLLKNIMENDNVQMAFISEPQVFQADIRTFMEYLSGDFCFVLNSGDVHDPDLPLVSNQAMGGTLCLWHRVLDPFITVHKLARPSFTPIILKLPDHPITIHIGIYLPTHGKDVEFIADMADLKICIDELVDKYPGAILFIRGDGNVNSHNKKRVNILNHFISDLALKCVPISHKTYHHFTE